MIIKETSYKLIAVFVIVLSYVCYSMIRFNSSFNTRIARLKELSLEIEHIIIMYDKYFDYDYKVKNFKNKFTAGNKMTRIIIRLIEDNRDFRKKIRETYI
jgi:hypothetical protein